MSDLKKAIAALERAGFVAVDGPNASVIVWERGWDVVRHDDMEAEVVLRVPITKLPSLLSGLTLEDVEKAVYHAVAYEGVPPHVPVEKFVGMIIERLRQ